jgi:DNA-binding HxlR family transcriptional regulator
VFEGVVVGKNRDSAFRDERIDELVEKQAGLDDICTEIFVTLLAYKRLRFNQLLRNLKKRGVEITQPTLKDHLDHLIDKKLVDCETGFQSAEYGLTEEIGSLVHVPQEDLKKWIEASQKSEGLPKKFKPLKLDRKKLFNMLNEEQLNKMVIDDLHDILSLNLFELKTFVGYDLKVNKFKSTADFWNFVGSPLYRMREKRIVEDCRNSEEYRRKLFERIDVLIDELRSDRELFREREERRKNLLKQ